LVGCLVLRALFLVVGLGARVIGFDPSFAVALLA
jgi:hypothetical protein